MCNMKVCQLVYLFLKSVPIVCGESAPVHTEDCQHTTTGGDVRSEFVFFLEKKLPNECTYLCRCINVKFGVPYRAPI